MPKFTGQLRPNEIFGALFNMVISQLVFADNIADTKASLVDRARVDGGLYGDTKLYYSTDVLKSAPWLNDAEAQNLLALHRPKAPEVQAIYLNVFRQISLTVDNYLTKQAWGTEGAFAKFTSVMLGWIRDTKRVYDSTTYNSYIGTVETAVGRQTISIDIASVVGTATGEEAARLEAEAIAEQIALLLVDLTDVSRDFNDYAHLRSFYQDDVMFVWNAKAMAKITKRDLPSLYHKDIVDRFGEYTLPGRYFGTVNATATAGNGTTVRSLIEQDLTVSETATAHVFAGDLIPSGVTAPAGTSYTEDPTILFKVMHVRSVPYMSAFEVGTSFFNPKSLTENHYLTWGHNTLEYLKNYPMITVREAVPTPTPTQTQNEIAPLSDEVSTTAKKSTKATETTSETATASN